MNNIAEMRTKQQNSGIERGKVQGRKRQMPDGLDLTNLEYLQYRDVTRAAKETGFTADYVSKVKNGLCKNVEVLAVLLRIGGKNRKTLETASA